MEAHDPSLWLMGVKGLNLQKFAKIIHSLDGNRATHQG